MTGLKVGKLAENIGALATVTIGVLLIVVAWLVGNRRGSATPIHIVPTWHWGMVVLPPDQISELNGFANVTHSAGRLLGAEWLSPLVAVLVLVSGIGFVGGIGTATSQLPFAAAADGLLPKAFGRLHPRWGTPNGITNVWLFEGKLAAGTVGVRVAAWLVYRRQKPAVRQQPLWPGGDSGAR